MNRKQITIADNNLLTNMDSDMDLFTINFLRSYLRRQRIEPVDAVNESF
jgi:hypothetical protein